VVLIRASDENDGWETYLVRRSAQSPVLADMWVFPGGTIRPDDLAAEAPTLAPNFSPEMAHAALSRPPGGPPPTQTESYAYFVAAARELVEEAGIVLGADPELSIAELAAQRESLEQGHPLASLAGELGIRFSLQSLIYYAHWITPEAIPQRFDTRFFVAELPEGQTASPSPFEMAEGIWIDVDAALQRSQERSLTLHFATINHLRRLAPHKTKADLLEFVRTKPVVPVMPATRELNGRITPHLPDELIDAW